MNEQKEHRRKRHTSSSYITKQSSILTIILSISLITLSIISNNEITFLQENNKQEQSFHRKLKKKKKEKEILQLSILPNDDDTTTTSILPKNNDFKKYSCNDIFNFVKEYTKSKEDGDHHPTIEMINNVQCQFAQTCNYHDGIFLSSFFCPSQGGGGNDVRTNLKEKAWVYVPILLILLLLLFRIVASTAEDYFSPSLEMFSIQLGLPSRFAGVTLLALGNGAPDIAATVSAMLQDRHDGYLMSVGELIGAAIFASTIIVSNIMFNYGSMNNTNYYPCTGGLLREVMVFMLTISLVWYQFFIVGHVDYSFIYLCLIIYGIYVAIVFAADVFHKKVYLPKLLQREEEEKTLLLNDCNDECCNNQESIETTLLLHNHASSSTRSDRSKSNSAKVVVENFVEAISNYSNPRSSWTISSPVQNDALISYQNADQYSTPVTTPTDAIKEKIVVVHLHHGGVQSLDYSSLQHADPDPSLPLPLHYNDPYHTTTKEEQSILSIVTNDVKQILSDIKYDVFECEDNGILDMILLTIEIPATILRILTIPIPCPGYYNRTMVGVSTILSTIWLQFYFDDQFDIDYNTILYYPYFPTVVPILLAMYVWIYGHDLQCLNLYIVVIIAIYGFAIAATWLDYLADFLVNVLSFLGILYHIPGYIMGLTVLAWGNAFADLSANVIIARKGLSEMAMTCCFAGPVFNILIGLGIGFFFFLQTKSKDVKHVTLTPSLDVGISACIINCLFIIGCSMFWSGKVPVRYGYVSVGIFGVYTVVALLVMQLD